MFRMCPSNVPRLGCSEVALKELLPKHRHPQGAQGDPWCSHTLPAPFEHRSRRMPRRNFKSAWKSRRPSHAEASSCNPSMPKPVAESFASHSHVQPYVGNMQLALCCLYRISCHPQRSRMHGMHARKGSCPFILNALPVLTSDRFSFLL